MDVCTYVSSLVVSDSICVVGLSVARLDDAAYIVLYATEGQLPSESFSASLLFSPIPKIAPCTCKAGFTLPAA
jgi:hypothetical protein